MPPRLSVILPTFNESAWLPETIAHLRAALAESAWNDVEIVVVDDGSSDDTAAVLAADTGTPPLTVVSISNTGRLGARRVGLDRADGDLVLFLDSRVHVRPGSLAFVRHQLEEHPDRRIWNGHAVTASTSAPWTRFWDAITFLAWRRYLRDPHTTSYGEDEFDWYPKGTTCFIAPREWLIAVSDDVDSLSDDPKLANDDTLMIRDLLRFGRISISPGFACTYHPRTSFRAFMRNAFHRGSVLVDGHLRPGLRLYRPFQAVVAVAPFGLLWALRSPRRFVGAVVGGSVAATAAARAAGVPRRDAEAFGLLLAPFSVAYGAGIVRGFRARRRGSRVRSA